MHLSCLYCHKVSVATLTELHCHIHFRNISVEKSIAIFVAHSHRKNYFITMPTALSGGQFQWKNLISISDSKNHWMANTQQCLRLTATSAHDKWSRFIWSMGRWSGGVGGGELNPWHQSTSNVCLLWRTNRAATTLKHVSITSAVQVKAITI